SLDQNLQQLPGLNDQISSLTSLLCVVSSPSVQRIITAEHEEDVILPCRAPENDVDGDVEWNRTDLESGQYVLMYRNRKFDQDVQSPSFRNRVDLQDMKNGDVSMVLKKVTTDDAGRYECRNILMEKQVNLKVKGQWVKSGDPESRGRPSELLLLSVQLILSFVVLSSQKLFGNTIIPFPPKVLFFLLLEPYCKSQHVHIVDQFYFIPPDRQRAVLKALNVSFWLAQFE
uniref:Ig-like domain-containing protein n=1 Tax=Fundulus heteroclitus TaxID=8078 RepID=A0A3Q2NP31_FUNHE